MSEFNLTKALERYRDMKQELGPALAQLDMLEKEIKQHILDTGELAEVEGVTISLRDGYTRYSYPSQAMEGYAAAHPEILQLRKEINVRPGVSLKVEK